MDLVLASGNPDKLTEVRAIFAGDGTRIIPVTDIVSDWNCEETGESIEENARLKALTAARATSMPSIADDTGLFVSALGGAPGVYSARYAGSAASYSDNVQKLIRVLTWERGESRSAVFRTAAAYADPSGAVVVALGEVPGLILDEPRGGMGFGYDPVFFVTALGCTYSECAPEVKNLHSHRARAFTALRDAIPDPCRTAV